MERRQHIAGVALLLSPWLACSGAGRGPSPPLPAGDQRPWVKALHDAPAVPAPGALVVRLAFGADADLDLYVTDPLRETVYFANPRSRAGGRLDRDRTCSDAPPRIETVVFEHPPPGRYRVGVDYPRPCAAGGPAVPFAVEATRDGHRQGRESAIEPRRFVPVVLEVDVE